MRTLFHASLVGLFAIVMSIPAMGYVPAIPPASTLDFTDAGVSSLINESSSKLQSQAVYVTCIETPIKSAIKDETFTMKTPEPSQLSEEACSNENDKSTWRFTNFQQTAWGSTSDPIKEKFFQALLTCRTSFVNSGGSTRVQIMGLDSMDPAAADGYSDVVVVQPTPERPSIMTVVIIP